MHPPQPEQATWQLKNEGVFASYFGAHDINSSLGLQLYHCVIRPPPGQCELLQECLGLDVRPAGRSSGRQLASEHLENGFLCPWANTSAWRNSGLAPSGCGTSGPVLKLTSRFYKANAIGLCVIVHADLELVDA